MSAEVAFALIGVVVLVFVLFTWAAFVYVPAVLSEDEEEHEHAEPPRGPAAD